MPDFTTSLDATTAAESAADAETAAAAAADAAPFAADADTAPGDAGSPTLEEALESADLATMSDEQVADFESGDPERVHAALARQLTPNANPEGGPSRVSIKALKPEDRARTVQALDLIRNGHAPADAFAEVFGISALPAAVAVAVGDPRAAPDPAARSSAAPQVAELESQLNSLQHRYREAKESYDPIATDLLEQMTDVKMDLRQARQEAAMVSTAWMGEQSQSHARAMENYGALITDPGSDFVPHCDDEILLAEAKSDPILDQPDWPEKIGQRVMDKFFRGHAAHSPDSARGLSHIPPAPRHAVRHPGSPVGPGFAAGALSPQTALAEIDRLTTEQQDAFIQSLDRLTSGKHASRSPLRAAEW